MLVLKLLAKGYGNREIAKEMFIAYPTVKNHLYNIYRKLNVTSARKAIAYYYQNIYKSCI